MKYINTERKSIMKFAWNRYQIFIKYVQICKYSQNLQKDVNLCHNVLHAKNSVRICCKTLLKMCHKTKRISLLRLYSYDSSLNNFQVCITNYILQSLGSGLEKLQHGLLFYLQIKEKQYPSLLRVNCCVAVQYCHNSYNHCP